MSRSEVLSADNLIGGVSQQPESLRSREKCELIENAYLSPVDGAGMRPPTEHIASMISGASADTFCHLIDRDETEQYMVVVRDGVLKVFGLDGTEYGVYAAGGGAPTLTYLTGITPSTDVRAVTIADYTFLLNREKEVEAGASLSDGYQSLVANEEHIYAWCNQTGFETDFGFGVDLSFLSNPPADGMWYTEYTTSASPTVRDTAVVMAQLFTVATPWDVYPAFGAQTSAYLGISVNYRDSLVRLKMDMTQIDEVRGVVPTDGLGNRSLKTAYREVESLEDLPPMAQPGTLFKVAGDADSGEDAFWVKYVSNSQNTTGQPFVAGYWQETIGAEVKYELDGATMPHQLIRKQDDAGGTVTGTPYAVYFEFGEASWEDRLVGDDDTNPMPSFVSDTDVSRKISDIFFHRNRLGLLSDDNVVLSGAGDYFNFFRTTVRDLLDNDRIDTSAAHTKVALLKNAVAYNGRLLAFSAKSQFAVDSVDIFSPANVEVETVGEFDSQITARPVAAGRTVFFPFTNGSFSGIRELYQLGDSLQYDAVDVTKEVPQYISGAIRHIAASTMTNDLIVVTDSTDGELYTYKYLWSGQDKAQSAWCRWDFGDNVSVVYCDFIENDLYLVIQRANEGLFLEKMRLQDGGADPDSDYLIHLDRRLAETDTGVTVTYQPVSDRTRIDLPYQTAGETFWVVGRATSSSDGGESYTVAATGATYIEVLGDVTGKPLWFGSQFNAKLTLTRPYMFEDGGRAQGVQIHNGRQSVRKLSVTFDRSLAFFVRIETDGRADILQEWNPSALEKIGTPVIGAQASFEGRVTIPVQAEVRTMRVSFESAGPYPFHLGGAEWEVQAWRQSGYRRR